MKNVHVIPTDKPSRLHLGNSGLVLCDLNYSSNTINSQNIYIASDEEIKEGDWYIYLGQINKRTRKNPKAEYSFPNYKKIILTTDQDLIKDGVQAIDDTLLEWFIKNPSCDEVEVGYGWIRLTETDNEGYWVSIPNKQFEMQQEEHPKQEPTLEEAADYIDRHIVQAMVETAKQKMYSEEEVLKLWNWLNDGFIIRKSLPTREELIGWFEQYKKK